MKRFYGDIFTKKEASESKRINLKKFVFTTNKHKVEPLEMKYFNPGIWKLDFFFTKLNYEFLLLLLLY